MSRLPVLHTPALINRVLRQAGLVPFPALAGGAGDPADALGGVMVRSAKTLPEAVDFSNT
jgi:hypothetical protein